MFHRIKQNQLSYLTKIIHFQLVDISEVLENHPKGNRLLKTLSESTYITLNNADNCLMVRILVEDLINSQPSKQFE